ncbi:MAG: lytic murein transglycosylase, partial [Candidatus Pacebacteria bacterium]|nr:lytic murein transglycosylase [Candidatus Paceibacterota bacterium]
MKKIVVLLLLLLIPIFIFAQSRDAEKKALETELEELEELIRQYNIDITKTEAEKQSLQFRINSLVNQINQLDLQIKQGNLVIQKLGIQIEDTKTAIQNTILKIEDLNRNLVDILNQIYRQDQKTYAEILLAEKSLSSFFNNLVNLEILNTKNKEILKDIKSLKANLEGQKVSLDQERESVQKTVQVQAIQKQQSAVVKQEQETLLGMTEAQYQQYLREKAELEKKAEEIRSKIFELVGVSTTDAPTFGEAIELAEKIGQITGVRPAFLLAILQQESAIGRNVGQCYLKDISSGTSIGIKTGTEFKNGIHPTRDLPLFLNITKELGKDPLKTPISCAILGVPGYGGAMGPAQFIPSTWMVYRTRLQEIL